MRRTLAHSIVAARPEVPELGERRRVERPGHDAAVAQGHHPLDHFAGSLLRKGHEQYLVRRGRARLYGIRRTATDDARLARARAGDDRQRTRSRHHRLALGGVQVFEESIGLGRCGQVMGLGKTWTSDERLTGEY